MNKFVFIAVNYNGSRFTIKYIESIIKLNKEEKDLIEIIIVDNNSNVEDIKEIERYCKKHYNIKIIKLNKNLGYFKGLNQGIKLVGNDPNSIIIVGNNDLMFDENFISNFKKIEYVSDILVIAPNIISKDGRQQNPLVVDRISSLERIKNRIYFSNYYIGESSRIIKHLLRRILRIPDVPLKNDYGQMIIKRGIGACYVLTPNFTSNFDKLDDRVFMWGEEALLTNQIESIGGKTLYDPSIIVHHYESASVSSIQTKQKYKLIRESYRVYKKYL